MRCKPGDLAIVIRGGETIKTGEIVLCVDFVGVSENVRTGHSHHDVWQVELNDGRRIGNLGRWLGVPDRYLRPIRDNEGEDETFEWAGKPEKVTV